MFIACSEICDNFAVSTGKRVGELSPYGRQFDRLQRRVAASPDGIPECYLPCHSYEHSFGLRIIPYIIYALALLPAATCYGQDDGPPVRRIEQVVVTGMGLRAPAGASVTVADSMGLAESAYTTLASLLGRHSHIFIKSYGYGGLATVAFRGTSASHTKVEWNGIELNDPMLGEVDFSLVPMWFSDRAEIYHGGSSLLRGPGALGGTVSLSTLPQWETPLRLTAAAGAGSYGLWRGYGAASTTRGKVSATLRGLYEKAGNDFRFYNNRISTPQYMRQQNAAYSKWGATGALHWKVSPRDILSVDLWFNSNERDLPYLMSDRSRNKVEYQKNDDVRAVARWNHYGPLAMELTSGISAARLRYFYSRYDEQSQQTLVHSDSHSRTLSVYNRFGIKIAPGPDTELHLRLNADVHDASFADYKNTLGDLVDTAGYDGGRTELGATLLVSQRAGRRWSFYALGALRYAGGGLKAMPSVGAEYRPVDGEDFTVRLNGTRNYHLPTLNDLYWVPGGNPDLDPERGYTADIGVSWQRAGNLHYGIAATGFVSYISDWILWQPGNYFYWTADNVRKVSSSGAELSAWIGAEIGPVAVKAAGNYACTRTTNRTPFSDGDLSVGQQLIYIPVHKGNITVDVSWRGFYLWWVWSATGRRYTTTGASRGMDALPWYDLHDVTVGKKVLFSGIAADVQLKANNLFSRYYQSIMSRATPERNIEINIRITF